MICSRLGLPLPLPFPLQLHIHLHVHMRILGSGPVPVFVPVCGPRKILGVFNNFERRQFFSLNTKPNIFSPNSSSLFSPSNTPTNSDPPAIAFKSKALSLKLPSLPSFPQLHMNSQEKNKLRKMTLIAQTEDPSYQLTAEKISFLLENIRKEKLIRQEKKNKKLQKQKKQKNQKIPSPTKILNNQKRGVAFEKLSISLIKKAVEPSGSKIFLFHRGGPNDGGCDFDGIWQLKHFPFYYQQNNLNNLNENKKDQNIITSDDDNAIEADFSNEGLKTVRIIGQCKLSDKPISSKKINSLEGTISLLYESQYRSKIETQAKAEAEAENKLNPDLFKINYSMKSMKSLNESFHSKFQHLQRNLSPSHTLTPSTPQFLQENQVEREKEVDEYKHDKENVDVDVGVPFDPEKMFFLGIFVSNSPFTPSAQSIFKRSRFPLIHITIQIMENHPIAGQSHDNYNSENNNIPNNNNNSSSNPGPSLSSSSSGDDVCLSGRLFRLEMNDASRLMLPNVKIGVEVNIEKKQRSVHFIVTDHLTNQPRTKD